MANAAKLTVLCVAQNCAPYAEVFLRSAASHGFRRAEFCKLILFVGESSDGTEAVCREFSASIPVKTVVINAGDLPKKDRQRISILQNRNGGHFNEGMWDFLIHYTEIGTPYYAGIHVDVEFVAPGLWDFLLNRLGNSAVVGIFDPGELIPSVGHMILSMPRFLPLVVMANRRRAGAMELRWSRWRPGPTNPRVLTDNGATALQRALASKISLNQEQELSRYLRHFGYVWTNAFDSPLHRTDGVNSRKAVATRLAALRLQGRHRSTRPLVEDRLL
jgi:hypothetical protein